MGRQKTLKAPISPLLWQEVSGPLVGIGIITSILSVAYLVEGTGIEDPTRSIIILTWTGMILMTFYQYRTWVTKQPTKSHAHVAHLFENEHSAWEFHAVVKNIRPVALDDPVFKDVQKPGKVDPVADYDRQGGNWFLYQVEYSHTTIIGHAGFEFTKGLYWTEVPIDELYSPIPHEILYKGFATSVGCAFLRLDLLDQYVVFSAKGKESYPVFMVRTGHYHARYDKRMKPIVQAESSMVKNRALATQVQVLNMEDELIKREEEARREGIRTGREQGKALVREYKSGIDEGVNLPGLRSHPRVYGGLIALSVGLIVLGWLMGWLRW